ncbi:anti-sigma factor family protein [Desulfurispora thermophila]|uniref:anti-sigma factor family protein n=1 Tax=Desulfurispora thermophila TaxID=265470 RepID=UPI000362D49D|nr:anti-sigma factor [Desulfurispora thermophila]
MQCHDFKRMIQDQLSGTLSASREKDFQQHLQTCASCAREWHSWHRAEILLRQGVKEIMAEIPVPEELSRKVLTACREQPAGRSRGKWTGEYMRWLGSIVAASLLLTLALGWWCDWLKKDLIASPRLAASLLSVQADDKKQKVSSVPEEKPSLAEEKLAGRQIQSMTAAENMTPAQAGRENGTTGRQALSVSAANTGQNNSVASVTAQGLPVESQTEGRPADLPGNRVVAKQSETLVVQGISVAQRGAMARPVQSLMATPDIGTAGKQPAAPVEEPAMPDQKLPAPTRVEIINGAIFKEYLVHGRQVVWGKQAVSSAAHQPLALRQREQLTMDKAQWWQYNQYQGLLWELGSDYSVLNWQQGEFVYSLEGPFITDCPGELLELFLRQQ